MLTTCLTGPWTSDFDGLGGCVPCACPWMVQQQDPAATISFGLENIWRAQDLSHRSHSQQPQPRQEICTEPVRNTPIIQGSKDRWGGSGVKGDLDRTRACSRAWQSLDDVQKQRCRGQCVNPCQDRHGQVHAAHNLCNETSSKLACATTFACLSDCAPSRMLRCILPPLSYRNLN